LLAPNRFGFTLRVPGDQRAVGAGGRFGFSEDVNPVVDLFFELGFVDEAVDLDGVEEMLDAFCRRCEPLTIILLPTADDHCLGGCILVGPNCL
jgi:hypothetical protein